ncbi:potassium-transporting ATPase subunit beta-like [Chiloscyllium plagiosum]|uniref:potassium-transporting ATPase subunit beta-like n=1 Tax=Chiloscyllium plagiosum TaxID=36176 RepID=UPI001CB85327|nr:potassium-transporting ATPase subunit beta-like [Chiloscyllium plagiosum]
MATFNEKKTCNQRMEEFKRFVWNPDTKEFMGRTPGKWVLISLYYAAFYVVICALFALALFVLLTTTDPYTPTYQDQLKSPGVTIRPEPKDLKISFNISNPKSWQCYVNALQHFLSAYNESVQAKISRNCTPGNYTFQTGYGPNSKYSCQFNREMLKNCSGLEDPTFGYKTGQPCVLIRMNRIINYLPGNGTTLNVTCGVLHAYPESIGDVVFYPENGTYDLSYFPYYGRQPQPNYTNPLVAVKFLSLKRNRHFEIQCKINGPGIINDNPYEKFEGRVIFHLDIQK